MQTYLEMRTELQSRLGVSSNSSKYPSSRIQQLIKDSHMWATSLFIWDPLVKARKTSSVINQEYYDYPSDFRTNTIIELELDGTEYDRKNYETYKDYKRNHPNSTDTKIFANFGRQYFIFPIPTVANSNTLVVWGAIQATQLSADGDTTIFSLSDEQGNEAIVQKALAVAKNEPGGADEKSAIAILTNMFDKQQKAKQNDQIIERPRFNVPDFFAEEGVVTDVANFTRTNN